MYKRQEHCRPRHPGNEQEHDKKATLDFKWMLGVCYGNSIVRGVKPEDKTCDAVSYTHLDVYKRQDLEAKGVAHICWNCGKAVQVPNKIIIGKNRVLLNQNTKLLRHHVYDDFDMDTVVGSVVQNPKNPALWGIRNADKVNWTYQKADGAQIPVAPGKTAGIATGVKILFPRCV